MKLLFKIVQLDHEPLDIPLDKIRSFPVYESHLHKAHEFMLLYEFRPSLNCDLDQYKEYLTSFFKKKYNAYTVVCSDYENQLEK